jgi:hypothetical protein
VIVHLIVPGLTINFISAPTITHQPKSTYAVKSGIAELICEATGTAPLKYKWYHTGVQVQSNERRRVLSNGHLYIKRVVHKKRKGISDTGEYYCTVTDDDRRVTRSRTVNISIGRKYTVEYILDLVKYRHHYHNHKTVCFALLTNIEKSKQLVHRTSETLKRNYRLTVFLWCKLLSAVYCLTILVPYTKQTMEFLMTKVTYCLSTTINIRLFSGTIRYPAKHYLTYLY